MDRRAGTTQLVVASLLLVASVGAIVALPAHPPGESPEEPERATLQTYDDPELDPQVVVTADLRPGASLPANLRARNDVHVTVSGDERRLQATIPLSEVRTLSDTEGVTGVRIDTSGVTADDDTVSPGVTVIGADRLHERGITGENVTVGVVDAGFHLSHPSIADQVGAYRAVGEPGDPAHGTAVADVVSDTAPDARLHLVAVGPTTTPGEYREAVEWLRASGADVVVDAGSYLGADSSAGVAAVAENAADEIAFVTSAGNYATRHWTGAHRPGDDRQAAVDRRDGDRDGDERSRLSGGLPGSVPQHVAGLVGGVDGDAGVLEWVTVGDDRRNRLGDGPIAGRVTATLSWEGEGEADYDLYLVRRTAAGEVVWDSATTGTGNRERLSVVVPRGRYAVAVGYDGGETRESRLELFSNRRLESATPAGSLAVPATVEGVIAVGALDDGSAAAFSSRGPTDDGRLGVDVAAPDDSAAGGGTSFAAPYVAGTIALVQSSTPGVGPRRAGEGVVRSATDVGTPGPDAATGHGRVNAVAAERTLDTLGLVDTPHPVRLASLASDDD